MASPATATSLRTRALSVGLCAFAYLYVFPYFPQLNNPNENVRLYMTAAIVEEGRYEIDTFRKRWGWVNDAAAYGGHYYSVKAPGTSLLGVPAYAAYRALAPEFDRTAALWWCRFTATIVPALLFLFFLHRDLSRRGHDPVLRESVFFSIAAGSMLYAYGLLFVSHTSSAACAFGAYMLLERPQLERAGPRMGLAGLLAGGVTLFEYPGLLCSLTLAALALWQLRRRPRALAWFAAGGLLPALLMMHFQYHAFGSPWTPGHLYMESTKFRAAHHEGVYGAVGLSGEALYGLLLDPGAGLFPLTPILAFAIWAAFPRIRAPETRAGSLCIFTICVGTTLVIASMNNWRGGWTIGPRYLAALVPFMGLLALEGLSDIHRRSPTVARVLALACLGCGLVLSGAPSAYYPHVPTSIQQPAAQLVPILIREGFAPYNALSWFGMHGTASMWPLFFCAAGMLLHSAMSGGPGQAARNLLLALPLCAGLCALAFAPAIPPSRRVLSAVGYVTRTWSPEGYDVIAEMRARVLRERAPHPRDVAELAARYRAVGQFRKAKRLERRASRRGRAAGRARP